MDTMPLNLLARKTPTPGLYPFRKSTQGKQWALVKGGEAG